MRRSVPSWRPPWCTYTVDQRRPLFAERIEAWANGPVVPRLYARLRGAFDVHPSDIPDGEVDALTTSERETVDQVLKFYGSKPSQWLSDLTHMEPPWKIAREGMLPGERGNREITLASMAEYYGSL